MIKRIFKKTPIIIIGTVLLSIPINKIYAYTFNVDFADTGKNTNSSSSSSGNHGNNSNNTDNWKTGSSSSSTSGSNPKIDKKWTCKYKYTVKSGNKVTVDGYNVNNEKIIADSLKISDKNKVLAGTSIGLSISEEKTVSYEVSEIKVDYHETTTYPKITRRVPNWVPTYTCILHGCRIGDSGNYPQANSSRKLCQQATKTKRCNGFEYPQTGSKQNGTKEEIVQNERVVNNSYEIRENNYKNSTDQKKFEGCKKEAINKAQREANERFGPSYKLKIPNSNDTSSSEKIEIEGNGPTVKFTDLTKRKDKKTATYKYSTHPCMNILTSKVRYVNETKNCNKDNEIIIADDALTKHWHYFVPLNAKSNEEIKIELVKNSTKNLASAQCKNVIEKYPAIENDNESTSYVDLIQPVASGQDVKFTGTTTKEKIEACKSKQTKNNCGEDYYNIIKGNWKCYLTSVIKIPINQNFYQEDEDEDGNITFTGFNFYYRPINIYNPFPNGFSPNSYWKEWNNNGRKDPDMEKSYTVMTYSAININTSIVRNYKNLITDGKQNTYSSWNNMSSRDGKSNFISTQGVVTRHNTGNYYRIGEGPSVEKKDGKLVMTGSDNS